MMMMTCNLALGHDGTTRPNAVAASISRRKGVFGLNALPTGKMMPVLTAQMDLNQTKRGSNIVFLPDPDGPGNRSIRESWLLETVPARIRWMFSKTMVQTNQKPLLV